MSLSLSSHSGSSFWPRFHNEVNNTILVSTSESSDSMLVVSSAVLTLCFCFRGRVLERSASSLGSLFLPFLSFSVRDLSTGGVIDADAFLMAALCLSIFDLSIDEKFPHSSELYLGYGDKGSLSFSLVKTARCESSVVDLVASTLVRWGVVTTSFLSFAVLISSWIDDGIGTTMLATSRISLPNFTESKEYRNLMTRFSSLSSHCVFTLNPAFSSVFSALSYLRMYSVMLSFSEFCFIDANSATIVFSAVCCLCVPEPSRAVTCVAMILAHATTGSFALRSF